VRPAAPLVNARGSEYIFTRGIAAHRASTYMTKSTPAAPATNTILVFNPVGRDGAARARAAPAARREHGAPFVIGLLDNHKHNSGAVLDRLQERLTEKIPGARFVRMKKPEAGKGAAKAMLDDLAAQCQAVVTGIAD
jgi:hypothetical protein